jgi:hypothetical protein
MLPFCIFLFYFWFINNAFFFFFLFSFFFFKLRDKIKHTIKVIIFHSYFLFFLCFFFALFFFVIIFVQFCVLDNFMNRNRRVHDYVTTHTSNFVLFVSHAKRMVGFFYYIYFFKIYLTDNIFYYRLWLLDTSQAR